MHTLHIAIHYNHGIFHKAELCPDYIMMIF